MRVLGVVLVLVAALLVVGVLGHFLVLAAVFSAGLLVGGSYGSARTALYYRRRRALGR